MFSQLYVTATGFVKLLLKKKHTHTPESELRGEGTRGNCLDDRNVLHLQCGSGYALVSVFQNSLNLGIPAYIL